MSSLIIPTSWNAGEALTEALLDAACDAIELYFNSDKIDAENIRGGGITDASIASNSVSTAHIADNAVTSTKLKSDAATDGNRAVTTDHIRDSAAIARCFADNTITAAKINPRTSGTGLGQISISSACVSQDLSSVYQQITNFSISLTTGGGPVIIGIMASGGGVARIYSQGNGGEAFQACGIKLVRSGTDRHVTAIGCYNTASNPSDANDPIGTLAGLVWFMDVPTAGTYTYSIEALEGGGAQDITLQNIKMYAYEVL